MKTATISDIAVALGKSRQAILKRAKNWEPTSERVQGGGNTYDVSTLSLTGKELTIVKRHLKNKRGSEDFANLPAAHEPAPAPAPVKTPELTSLTGRQVEIMDARVWFMRLIEQRPAGFSIKKTMNAICTDVASGGEPSRTMALAANDRQGEGRTLAPRTLMRWWSERWLSSGKSPASLAPLDADAGRISRDAVMVAWLKDYRPGSRLPVPAEVPIWLPILLDEYRQPQEPGLVQALKECCRLLPPHIQPPSYDQAKYLFGKLPITLLERGRKTGAEYRALMPFCRRDWSQEEPFSVGQIDGHSLKAYVANPVSGAHFHPEICAVICMHTKYLAGWSAGVAESWRTVSDAFRHACQEKEDKFGGVFSRIEADRGAGNMATTNSDKLIGIFARAGCTLVVPEKGGNPQGHGGIERSNQSIWIKAAKTLITYTGKDMDRVSRKKVYTRLEQDLNAAKKAGQLKKTDKTSELLLSWREFLDWCERAVWEYNNTPHRALPKITDQSGRRRHMTPTEAVKAAMNKGWQPVQHDDSLLPYLFMPHERIKKITRGEFTLHGNTYHSWDLAHYHNQPMIAAYDIHDPHVVWELTNDQQPVCQAFWNGNRVLGRPESVKEMEDRKRTEGRANLKQKHLNMIHAEKPVPEVVITPEMRALKEKIVAQDIEAVPAPSAKIITLQLPEPAVAAEFNVPTDERDKYKLWCMLEGLINGGLDLDEDQQRFYEGFKRSAIWKAYKKLGK